MALFKARVQGFVKEVGRAYEKILVNMIVRLADDDKDCRGSEEVGVVLRRCILGCAIVLAHSYRISGEMSHMTEKFVGRMSS